MLCVPRNLVEQDAWDHPENGSRMEAFKRVVGTYVVSVAAPGFEYWIGADGGVCRARAGSRDPGLPCAAGSLQ